jgi:hypothetical protein
VALNKCEAVNLSVNGITEILEMEESSDAGDHLIQSNAKGIDIRGLPQQLSHKLFWCHPMTAPSYKIHITKLWMEWGKRRMKHP